MEKQRIDRTAMCRGGILMSKYKYIHGAELVECKCGVWTVTDIPCWNETDRKQLYVEAQAQLNQAVRNLGYELAKALRLVK